MKNMLHEKLIILSSLLLLKTLTSTIEIIILDWQTDLSLWFSMDKLFKCKRRIFWNHFMVEKV